MNFSILYRPAARQSFAQDNAPIVRMRPLRMFDVPKAQTRVPFNEMYGGLGGIQSEFRRSMGDRQFLGLAEKLQANSSRLYFWINRKLPDRCNVTSVIPWATTRAGRIPEKDCPADFAAQLGDKTGALLGTLASHVLALMGCHIAQTHTRQATIGSVKQRCEI